MIKVKNEGIILEKTSLSFEDKAVLNPACLQEDDVTHMFYRAINNQNISSIGYCQLVNNKVIKRLPHPVIFTELACEKNGVEDPRITFLEGTYYLFYTAYDGKNAVIAYATSQDLVHFIKHGPISPQFFYEEAKNIFSQSKLNEKYNAFNKLYQSKRGKDVLLFEKDASLFPQKINNKFALLHRILPGIQIIYFDKFTDLTADYWRNYLKNLNDSIVMDPLFSFENRCIGGGCPPIKTKDGWLMIFHTVEETPIGKTYHASAALLDLNNPLKVLGRLSEPLFSPTESWEKNGITHNVVFPTGAIIKDGRIYIYYGAADDLIAAKSANLQELLTELKKPLKL